MSSWHEFIFMGKHGAFVWSSYFMTLVVLLGLFIGFRMMLKSLKKQVEVAAVAPDSKKQKARKLKVSQPD
ncbi:heme exporter protein CcmD [Kangiella sp. HD9-110m-PIT-SAG07]|nr:heme exporter protein CcmD [Kangiella sp. HD9-110m-PIT-SAG07]